MTNQVKSNLFPRGKSRRPSFASSASFHLQAKHTATHNKHGLSKIIHSIQDGTRGPSHVQVILDEEVREEGEDCDDVVVAVVEDGCCCCGSWSFPYVGGRPKINIAATIGDNNNTPFDSWVWNASSSSSLPNEGTIVQVVRPFWLVGWVVVSLRR